VLAELAGVEPLNLTPIARFDESQFQPDAMYGDFFQRAEARLRRKAQPRTQVALWSHEG